MINNDVGYPETLLENRTALECNFTFALWKQPDLIDDYYKSININQDLLDEDARFYYSIALQLRKLGYSVFDNITLHTFLADKPAVAKEFNAKGGFATVLEIMELVNPDNIHSYYDDLIKSNMILRLHKANFPVEVNKEKYQRMTSSEVYDYYDALLNSICLDKVEKIKAANLSDGYDDFIANWDKGTAVGFKIGYPLLNYHLAGVHKKNLLLHLAHIGKGKTTSAILLYILPVIENGENICIIANEQAEDEWRQMILASVLFNKIGNTSHLGMNRHRLITGRFTPEQKEALKQAEAWLKAQKGQITFITLNDYAIGNVRKIIKKYARMGVGMFVFDTLKPEQENSDKAWADFSEAAKELFMLAKKEDVAIVATAQLSSDSMGRKYLDLSCTGKSRAIAETAGQVTMMRSLSKEEKEKMKAYHYPRTEDGKTSKVKQYIDLNVDEDYVVIFMPKNRFGSTDVQILYKRDMAFNTMKEIGYIEIPYDGFKIR